MLNAENCLIIMIDMQEKLVKATNAAEAVDNAHKLLQVSKIINIPVLTTEQYPKGLGKTVEQLKQDYNVFEKTFFSCIAEPEIEKFIINSKRNQIILFGTEAHICVYQTALDLVFKGFEVYMVKDASASRENFQKESAVELMKQSGVKITTTEITIFELVKTSKHPEFKEIQKLIK